MMHSIASGKTWGPAKPQRSASPTNGSADPVGVLLRRIALGDEAAFAALYDEVSPRIYGMCLRVVRDPAQAEEVTQEVLIEVWRTARRFDPRRGSALAWLTTLAHRRAVDRVRSATASAGRQRRVANPVGSLEVDPVFSMASDHIELQQVRRCLETLTEIQRQAVVLAYYGGNTYQLVAQHLSLPLPTVKTRIRDGLIRLRECMQSRT